MAMYRTTWERLEGTIKGNQESLDATHEYVEEPGWFLVLWLARQELFTVQATS